MCCSELYGVGIRHCHHAYWFQSMVSGVVAVVLLRLKHIVLVGYSCYCCGYCWEVACYAKAKGQIMY